MNILQRELGEQYASNIVYTVRSTVYYTAGGWWNGALAAVVCVSVLWELDESKFYCDASYVEDSLAYMHHAYRCEHIDIDAEWTRRVRHAGWQACRRHQRVLCIAYGTSRSGSTAKLLSTLSNLVDLCMRVCAMNIEHYNAPHVGRVT